MTRIAIVVLCDTESHGDHGRITNALELAKETRERGGDARIVFDGAGTRWVPQLHADSGTKGKLFSAVRDSVDGACAFCAAAFHVKDAIIATGTPLLSDFDEHPSLYRYIADGYHLVTF